MKGAIFYLLLIVGVIYFLIGRGEDESSRKAQKLSELTCQNEVHFDAMVYDKSKLHRAKYLLNSKHYEIRSAISKAEFMKSRISTYLAKDGVDKVVKRVIEKLAKGKTKNLDTKKLTIEYLIVENDKHNLIKRDEKVKFFVGYLKFKFIMDDKIVYEAQTDFIGKMGEDIPRRINCVITSFFHL